MRTTASSACSSLLLPYVRQIASFARSKNALSWPRIRLLRWRTDNGEACGHIGFRSSGDGTSVCPPRSPMYQSRRRNRQPGPYWRHTVNSRAPATRQRRRTAAVSLSMRLTQGRRRRHKCNLASHRCCCAKVIVSIASPVIRGEMQGPYSHQSLVFTGAMVCHCML